MRDSHLTILVATLLGITDLVFNLNTAGTCFDHLFREQVGRFLVSKPSVNISDDRNHMSLEVIDLIEN